MEKEEGTKLMLPFNSLKKESIDTSAIGGASARAQQGSADLPINGSNDGCAHVHAGDEAVVEVAVQDEGLQDCCKEHEEGQRVAPPVGGALLFSERYQHSERARKKKKV